MAVVVAAARDAAELRPQRTARGGARESGSGAAGAGGNGARLGSIVDVATAATAAANATAEADKEGRARDFASLQLAAEQKKLQAASTEEMRRVWRAKDSKRQAQMQDRRCREAGGREAEG